MRLIVAIVAWLFLPLSLIRAGDLSPMSMFTTALERGDLPTIETLLSVGFDPNATDQHGQTPLRLAIAAHQNRVVEFLLARHVDPNGPLDNSRYPARPLQFALEYGNLNAASILIAAGAKVDRKGFRGRTALHAAAAAGNHLDVVQFLIEKGADLNARDADGMSPLDEAVRRGSLSSTAILLANGARLNERNTQTGETPINEAAYRGHSSLVVYLLQFHPDLRILDKQNRSPLDNAIRMGKEESSLLLLDAEPKERMTSDFLDATMDAAIKKDESLLVRGLLRRGAPANGSLLSGSTALEIAAATGIAKSVRELLANKADPNISGRNGSSPLEEASLKGFASIAGLLLDGGALVNHLNGGSGTTALYAAASFGREEVANVLLERGADPNLCGAGLKSPYQAAIGNGYRQLAMQIQKHGGSTKCEAGK